MQPNRWPFFRLFFFNHFWLEKTLGNFISPKSWIIEELSAGSVMQNQLDAMAAIVRNAVSQLADFPGKVEKCN